MISCENIFKVFSGEVILDSFSYTFEETGFYLLLGESGSGKTTFLNILSGFLPFEGGRITWNGHFFEEQVKNSLIENEFDYITQDSFFVDFLSVMDNMRLLSCNDGKIRSVLTRFGLEKKRGQDSGNAFRRRKAAACHCARVAERQTGAAPGRTYSRTG